MQRSCLLEFMRVAGPTRCFSQYVFLTVGNTPYQFMNCADGVRIFLKAYFRRCVIMSPRSRSRAFAIFKHVTRVGLRLPLSMKLMAARLSPVISASFSCDTRFSLRAFSSSAITFFASLSESLSLIIRNNQGLVLNLIRNYSYINLWRCFLW